MNGYTNQPHRSGRNTLLGTRCFVVAALLFAAVATNKACAQRLTQDELKHSVWDSTYTTVDGRRIRAALVFDGTSGYYNIPGARGRLSQIQYSFDTGGNSTEWIALIEGTWSMGGSSGEFSLIARNDVSPLTFEGDWHFTNGGRGRGDWKGRFDSVLSRPDGGGGLATNGSVTYGSWQYNDRKSYYYRRCSFPAGGFQYLIYYKDTKPDWVYWYNPAKEVFWCACPTSSHPRFGNAIRQGKDLFLVATQKARDVADCTFPAPGNDGANFEKGKTKDKDGSTIDLGCPPDDLP